MPIHDEIPQLENVIRRYDKVLVAGVAGVILLVIIAFVVVLARPEPTYLPEETAEGVAHNYLLAVRKGEYQRAYGYLSPTLPNYPADTGDFERILSQYPWDFRMDGNQTLQIKETRVTGETATVIVQETVFNNGRLFDSGSYNNEFRMILERVEGKWRLTSSDRFWSFCWSDKNSNSCQ